MLRTLEERNALVVQFIHLPAHVYLKLMNRSSVFRLGRQEAINYGNVALVHAADHWDPSKGTAFISYAYTCILKEIVARALEFHTIIRIPLTRKQNPRAYQLKEKIRASQKPLPKNIPQSEEEGSMEDSFDDLIKHLNPQEQQLLRLKFVDGLTFTQIMPILGCRLKQTVQLRMRRILTKLRKEHERA